MNGSIDLKPNLTDVFFVFPLPSDGSDLSFYSAPSEVVFSLLRASMTILRVIPSQLLAAIADANGNDVVESAIGGTSLREAARMFDMVPSTLTRQVKRARRKAL